MSRLETVEVNISYIKEHTYDFRIESEFYKKEDISAIRKLETLNAVMLGNGLSVHMEISQERLQQTERNCQQGLDV